ncbi:conserved protein of unknown function [Agrobacterium pusense]|jgi:hypothetical protein|uniref:Uncharacterized protein n=1 Tax=Agrobacterium pusense TaxID=648995 RepID=U4Q1V2_9HYPH|nr:conserved protein of unknown function [Agrobacterium pusense]SDE32673.1 hypothetical protein SAMN05421750_101216 [Agrobacterium pusense]
MSGMMEERSSGGTLYPQIAPSFVFLAAIPVYDIICR